MDISLNMIQEPAPKVTGGLVRAIDPRSLAQALKLQPGDEVLRVNGQAVEDVIDVQYYADRKSVV